MSSARDRAFCGAALADATADCAGTAATAPLDAAADGVGSVASVGASAKTAGVAGSPN